MIPNFDIWYDDRVQKRLNFYNITKKCNCNVQGYKILKEDYDKFRVIGTYNPPKKDTPAIISICEDIINDNFPSNEFDWIILHECGHLYYRHPKHPDNRTKREYEFDADYWACKQQSSIRYGIEALLLLCNGDTNKISHSRIIHDVSGGERYMYGPITYAERIKKLEQSNLHY